MDFSVHKVGGCFKKKHMGKQFKYIAIGIILYFAINEMIVYGSLLSFCQGIKNSSNSSPQLEFWLSITASFKLHLIQNSQMCH